ncbi:hypothetical protein JZ751_001873 [Albula glossodonta]|uniref:Tudor domain-containing protein n=1 Tax=Albula glossodonta TaxID=121402 RepID=A0A8T2PUW6_9TELE|nr:hypothetical protein JZ751_001873 [Albula glossodonta]
MANGCTEMPFARGMVKSDDLDIWDDTALIKAYDKAVASFKWRVGDACCAFWSVDGNLYSATVTSIDEEKGSCTVVYTDYGNKEEQNLADLQSENCEVEVDGAGKTTQVKEDESLTDESEKSSHLQMHSHMSPVHQHRPRSSPMAPSGPSSRGPVMSPVPPQGTSSSRSEQMSGGPGAGFPGWSPMMSFGPPMIPPPPPLDPNSLEGDDALGCMLLSWYMSGYHTGYYLGLKQGCGEAASRKRTHHRLVRKKRCLALSQGSGQERRNLPQLPPATLKHHKNSES